MMHYSQVYIYLIIDTFYISDIRIPLRDVLTCGYFKNAPKDVYTNDQWKFFKGFDECIQEKEESVHFHYCITTKGQFFQY